MGAVTALLPASIAAFLVVSDTHLVDHRADHAREFASRLRQNTRIEAALRVTAGLGHPVLHLGDLVQDYPESAAHRGLLERAVDQWRGTVGQIDFVPGNTDIGDPHDPASPAAPVTAETTERFSDVVGGSWCMRDIGPVRAIGLAASLFNSGLDAEHRQWHWLEGQLASGGDRRLVLFFHYPVFLRSPADPDVGHYDVINEPARSRLIGLIREHAVQAVFTGHSHFAFFNRIGATRVYGTPSTSFTRPGFSELFASAAPPDRGRDDVPKLGLLLARVHHDGIRVHPVRTGVLAGLAGSARPVVSAVPADVPTSPLGVVLRHPLAGFAEVPDVFPSVVRQPVRNDYPLLGCLELGAGQVSVPVAEADDRERAERLQVLREEGVRVTARTIWAAGQHPPLPAADAPVDAVELVLLDRVTLAAEEVRSLRQVAQSWPVRLSAMVRSHRTAAELPRWRYGFTADDLPAVAGVLDGAPPVRIALHAADAATIRQAISQAAGSGIAAAACDLIAAAGPDARSAAGELADLFLTACEAGVGGFLVDGLIELDRTLDLSSGLLDRACNPQPAFHALRILNSLVHAGGPATITRIPGGFRVDRDQLSATVATSGTSPMPDSVDGAGDVIDLATGTTATSPDRPAGPWMILHADDRRASHEQF